MVRDEDERVEYVPLASLRPYERNPRINDGAVDAVAESIRQYGFKVPMVIDDDNVIITGHTRYKAAMKIGMDKVPVIRASDLTPEQAKAFRIADNKTSDLSIWDNKILLEELDDIQDGLFTGFETSEIFNDVDSLEIPLDESDNSVLDDNDDGVIYEVRLRTQDRELADRVEHFIRSNADV